jgi:hypothetical protein
MSQLLFIFLYAIHQHSQMLLPFSTLTYFLDTFHIPMLYIHMLLHLKVALPIDETDITHSNRTHNKKIWNILSNFCNVVLAITSPNCRSWYLHFMKYLIQKKTWIFCCKHIVATLALGSRPRQGLARLRAKWEAWEAHHLLPRVQRMWRNEPSHSQMNSRVGSWSPEWIPDLFKTHHLEEFFISLESYWNVNV